MASSYQPDTPVVLPSIGGAVEVLPSVGGTVVVLGYLAHENPPPPVGLYSRTMPRALGGWAFSYERGSPVVPPSVGGAVVQGYLAYKKQPSTLGPP